jgi:hypothetical protein
MIDHAHFLIFLSAAVLLAISPGPGMIYVLARSLRGGRAVGLASSFGTATGGMAHVLAAGLGLSVILARSAQILGSVATAAASNLGRGVGRPGKLRSAELRRCARALRPPAYPARRQSAGMARKLRSMRSRSAPPPRCLPRIGERARRIVDGGNPGAAAAALTLRIVAR